MTIEFAAALTKDNARKGEQAARDWGLTRRLALGVLTRSSSDFKDMDTHGYRSIPLEGIRQLSVGGQHFNFEGGKA